MAPTRMWKARKRNEKKRNKQNWVKIVRQPEVAVAVSEILHRYGVYAIESGL